MSGEVGALPECNVKTLMTPDHTPSMCAPSGYYLAGNGRSSAGSLTTGHHEKAPASCPCSRLAALHGAPRSSSCDCYVVHTISE